jgi:hypothetical protein
VVVRPAPSVTLVRSPFSRSKVRVVVWLSAFVVAVLSPAALNTNEVVKFLASRIAVVLPVTPSTVKIVCRPSGSVSEVRWLKFAS